MSVELECALTIKGEDDAADDFERDAKGVIIRRSQGNVIRAIKALGLQFEIDEDVSFGEITVWRPDRTLFFANNELELKKLWLAIERQFGFRPAWQFFRTVFNDYAERTAKSG